MLFEEFWRIAAALNRAGIEPTLMGSLGLEIATGAQWDPGDIDIHVPGDPRGWEAPDEKRIYDFDIIAGVMEELGYTLVDRHEHEFLRGDLSVEFGAVDTLPEFAGVTPVEMDVVEHDGVRFRLPTLAQYLRIYQASSQDSYRNEQNNSKDFPKIAYLEQKLSTSPAP